LKPKIKQESYNRQIVSVKSTIIKPDACDIMEKQEPVNKESGSSSIIRNYDQLAMHLSGYDKEQVTEWVFKAFYNQSYYPFTTSLEPCDVLRAIHKRINLENKLEDDKQGSQSDEKTGQNLLSKLQQAIADNISLYHKQDERIKDLRSPLTGLSELIISAAELQAGQAYEILVEMAESKQYIGKTGNYGVDMDRILLRAIPPFALKKKDARVEQIFLDRMQEVNESGKFLLVYRALCDFNQDYLEQFFDKGVELAIKSGDTYCSFLETIKRFHQDNLQPLVDSYLSTTHDARKTGLVRKTYNKIMEKK